MQNFRSWQGIMTIICLFSVSVAVIGCSPKEPIKVGILHSLTGTLAASEGPVADATLMAIAEINDAGGILGRTVEPIIVDIRSDAEYAAEQAERLIVEEGVAAIFGCWTSTCRKSVRGVVEQHDSLLIYSVQYEGLEESPNIVYIGSTPNQQIIPAVEWAFVKLGQRFFLVGSDYVFPRAANEIIKEKVARLGGEIVGEEYLLLGSNDVENLVEQIVQADPDVILNTINGDSNVAFFRKLREANISADDIPTLSFSVAEAEIQTMDLADMVGHYAAWNYFQTIDSPVNRRFIDSYQARYGADRVTADPIEAGYIGAHLWADVVEDAQTTDPRTVARGMANWTISAPQGFVRVDAENQHLWKMARVGQIGINGQFDIVWDPGVLIPPRPFPRARTRSDWEIFLQDLYLMWSGHWENTGK